MKISYLQPYGTKVKSFYYKAQLIENGKFKILKSYDTVICAFDPDINCVYRCITDSDLVTVTTNRHIRSFMYHFVGYVLNRKQFMHLPYKAKEDFLSIS